MIISLFPLKTYFNKTKNNFQIIGARLLNLDCDYFANRHDSKI